MCGTETVNDADLPERVPPVQRVWFAGPLDAFPHWFCRFGSFPGALGFAEVEVPCGWLPAADPLSGVIYRHTCRLCLTAPELVSPGRGPAAGFRVRAVYLYDGGPLRLAADGSCLLPASGAASRIDPAKFTRLAAVKLGLDPDGIGPGIEVCGGPPAPPSRKEDR